MRHVHVGELVLDRLERRDRPAEGEAAQRVLARHVERGLRAADLLEGEQHRRAVEQRAPAAASPRRRRPAARPARREGDPRVRARGVHGRHAAARVTPAPGQVDQEQGDGAPSALRGRRTTAKSATSPSATGTFVPVSGPPSARRLDRAGARRARALGEGEAADGLAQRELGQPPLLLLVGAGEQDRLGREVHGRGERRRREAAAQLLGDHAQLEVAEARRRRGSPGIAVPVQPISAMPRQSSRS